MGDEGRELRDGEVSRGISFWWVLGEWLVLEGSGGEWGLGMFRVRVQGELAFVPKRLGCYYLQYM